MQIVPVIDIRNGVVVRAVAGDRQNYRPLVSPLSGSSEPRAVVAGLRATYRFNALYVADLDAIEGRPTNDAIIEALTGAQPDLRLWIDAGVGSADGIAERLTHSTMDLVIGSESFADIGALASLRDEPRAILSLDFRGDDFIGAPELLVQNELWPSRVIVMTLARVGLGRGPDFARLSEIVARAGKRQVYAAGGVRNAADLARLEAMGVAGALVASALHDGLLTPADIATIAE